MSFQIERSQMEAILAGLMSPVGQKLIRLLAAKLLDQISDNDSPLILTTRNTADRARAKLEMERLFKNAVQEARKNV